MADEDHALCDTNILVRMGEPSDAQHELVASSVRALLEQGVVLYYTLQNMAELWNVCTRPKDRNGLGLSSEETRQRVADLEALLVHLPDDREPYGLWRALVERYGVRGVQVHDARLVATMQAHGLRRILTLNGADFGGMKGLWWWSREWGREWALRSWRAMCRACRLGSAVRVTVFRR